MGQTELRHNGVLGSSLSVPDVLIILVGRVAPYGGSWPNRPREWALCVKFSWVLGSSQRSEEP
jgi:hypothetical protein